VDTSGEMGEMARLLRQAEEEEEGGRETITGVYFRQYLPTSNKVQYDLVTSCYALGDIASHGIKKLSLAALWRKTKNYLVRVCHSFWVCVDHDDAIYERRYWLS
jgi:hypothetical protein